MKRPSVSARPLSFEIVSSTRTGSEVAGGHTALLQIFLVILLTAIERACGRDLRRDGPLEFAAGIECCSRLLGRGFLRSEEHTSELQSQSNLVCRLLLEKKKK